MTQGAKDISRDPRDKGRFATWDAIYRQSQREWSKSLGLGRDYRKRTSRNKRKKIDNDSNDRDSDNKTMGLNRAVATG